MKRDVVSLFLWTLVVVVSQGCVPPDPPPVYLGPPSSGDDASDAACPDTEVESASPSCQRSACTGESYPCGPYGTGQCDTVRDLSFVPVNEPARQEIGAETTLSLGQLFRSRQLRGLLLFGTAGWCTFCGEEARWLNSVYASFQETEGDQQGVEFVAVVFQDDYGRPATEAYATQYATRSGFGFPAVADTNGDILRYFDAQAAPGNILVTPSDMKIRSIIQGFDQPAIDAALRSLDGSVDCR